MLSVAGPATRYGAMHAVPSVLLDATQGGHGARRSLVGTRAADGPETGPAAAWLTVRRNEECPWMMTA